MQEDCQGTVRYSHEARRDCSVSVVQPWHLVSRNLDVVGLLQEQVSRPSLISTNLPTYHVRDSDNGKKQTARP